MQQPPSLYEAYGHVSFINPKLNTKGMDDGWEFTDFRDNQFVKPDAENFGKCYLYIGEGC